MSTGARNVLMASLLLTALAITLLLRLDAKSLSDHFYHQLQGAIQADLQAEHADISFLHGIGLRLDGVQMQHPRFRFTAGHLNLTLRLMPLLFGKFEAQTLEIHDASMQIDSDAITPTSTTISALPVQRIRLIRAQIQTQSGEPLLENLRLDLRNIGPNRETTWEMSARKHHQSISGNGRLLFRAGEITRGFGKVKMEQFELARLRPFITQPLFAWLNREGSRVNGAATIDIDKHQRWALFGEVDLNQVARDHASPLIRLRGKLNHASTGQLSWRDSFIHIGKDAVIAIEGNCSEQAECSMQMRASQVQLSEWQPFTPAGVSFRDHISGMTDLKAALNWNRNRWSGKLNLQISDASLRLDNESHTLPDLLFQAGEISGTEQEWHSSVTITSPEAAGSMLLKHAQQQHGALDLFIDSQDADAALWKPLTNMVLSTLGAKPMVNGNGIIEGKLHLHRDAEQQLLSLNLDATETALIYEPWLNKPKGEPARCDATITFKAGTLTALWLESCLLHHSSVESLHWKRHRNRQTLRIDRLALQPADLSPLLPGQLQHLTGSISGGGKAVWRMETPWYHHLNGDWQLHDIGTDGWRINGSLSVKAGIYRSEKLNLESTIGLATIYGAYDPARNHADIDIVSGSLDWNRPASLTGFWQSHTITGRIFNARLKLLGNDWQHIQGGYTFRNGALTLNHLKSQMADGLFGSKKITLTPDGEEIRIDGYIRTEGIQLRKVARIHHWLDAAIDGKLQANLLLHGRIGQSKLNDWQGSNGDIVIYDGNWKHQIPPSIMQKLGITTPSLRSYDFSQLKLHLDIDKERAELQQIALTHLNETWLGSATIDSDLHLSGSLHSQKGQKRYRLASRLPKLEWQPEAVTH